MKIGYNNNNNGKTSSLSSLNNVNNSPWLLDGFDLQNAKWDPNESEFYSKHANALRRLDDDDDGNNGNNIGYDSIIAQAKGDNKITSNRHVKITTQRQQSRYSQRPINDSYDWASQELRQDIQADGSRQIVKMIDITTVTTTLSHLIQIIKSIELRDINKIN